MILQKLSLLNYKNFESVTFDFDTKINCLVGRNGVGKTNVIDAIYHLSFGKSYFNPITLQNIKHGEEFFVVEGQYQKTMQELAQNGNTSTAQLESQRQVLISRRQAFADLKFEQMMKIREVLTVSQRETMAEFMMEKRSENGFFNQRKGFNKVSQDFEDSFI